MAGVGSERLAYHFVQFVVGGGKKNIVLLGENTAGKKENEDERAHGGATS